MRLFYLFKLLQVILTSVVLISIFSTSEICSPFIHNKFVVERILNNATCKQLKTQVDLSNVGIGAIVDSDGLELEVKSRTRMGKFLSEVLRSWDRAWGYDEKLQKESKSIRLPKKDLNSIILQQRPSQNIEIAKAENSFTNNAQSNFKTNAEVVGFRQCAKIQLNNYFEKGKPNGSVGFVLQTFGVPILIITCYFVFIFFHIIAQNPLPYGCFLLSLVFTSGLGWFFVILQMISLEYNWDTYWAYSNVRPELMTSIVILQACALIITAMCFFEVLYNAFLIKEININNESKSNLSTLSGEVTYYDPNAVESAEGWTSFY